MKILLISNMYPSKKDKTYGTFVKMFKESLEHNADDIIFDCCFIRGRSNNFMVKAYKYIIFYFTIIYKHFFLNMILFIIIKLHIQPRHYESVDVLENLNWL